MEKAVAKESMIHETGQEVLFGLNYSDYNSSETDKAAVNHDCKRKRKKQLSVNCQALSPEWNVGILHSCKPQICDILHVS